MGSLVQVKLKLSGTGLEASLRQLSGISPRLPSYLANKACKSIAIKAAKAMPVATAAKIQAEMNAVGYVRNKDDKDWRKTNNEQRHLTAAERIVLASIHPNSAFNRRTGGVFFRQKPMFSSPAPGGGGTLTGRRGYKLGAQNRLRFWAWIEERAQRMIAARKSSGGFYRLGANVVKFIFMAAKMPVSGPPIDASGIGEAIPGAGNVSKNIGRVAGGKLATETSSVARASFWVTSTEPDSKGANTAISKVLQPVWQKAVDDEAAEIMEYAATLYIRAAERSGLKVTH